MSGWDADDEDSAILEQRSRDQREQAARRLQELEDACDELLRAWHGNGAAPDHSVGIGLDIAIGDLKFQCGHVRKQLAFPRVDLIATYGEVLIQARDLHLELLRDDIEAGRKVRQSPGRTRTHDRDAYRRVAKAIWAGNPAAALKEVAITIAQQFGRERQWRTVQNLVGDLKLLSDAISMFHRPRIVADTVL